VQAGDRVIRMARYAPSNPVALFEPQRALVLGHIKDTSAELAAGHARSSWAFLLQPVDQHSTRLLVRCRGNSLMARLQGPVQFVMQRKMMLGIKQRVEGNPLPSPADLDPARVRFWDHVLLQHWTPWPPRRADRPSDMGTTSPIGRQRRRAGWSRR
jgi:hypothetical protein